MSCQLGDPITSIPVCLMKLRHRVIFLFIYLFIGAGDRSVMRKEAAGCLLASFGNLKLWGKPVFFSLPVNMLALCSRVFWASLWWISLQELLQKQKEVFVCLLQSIQGCSYPCSEVTPQELLISCFPLNYWCLKFTKHARLSKTT